MARNVPWNVLLPVALVLSLAFMAGCGTAETPASSGGADGANELCDRFPDHEDCGGGAEGGGAGEGGVEAPAEGAEGNADGEGGPQEGGEGAGQGEGAQTEGAEGTEGEGEGEGEEGVAGAEGQEGQGQEGQVGEGEGAEGAEGDEGGAVEGAVEGAEGVDEGGADEGGEGHEGDEGGEGDEGDEGGGEGVDPPDPCSDLEGMEDAGTVDEPQALEAGGAGPFYLRGEDQWFQIDVPADTRLAIAALDQGDPFYVTDLRLELPDQNVGPVGADGAITFIETAVADATTVKLRVVPTGEPPEGALCAIYMLRVYFEPQDAECSDDPLEDNDAANGLTLPLTPQGARPTETNRFSGLQICPGDSDWLGLDWEGLPLERVFIDIVSDDIDQLTVSWVQANGDPPVGCGNLCLNPEAVGNTRKSIAIIQSIEGLRYYAHVRGTGDESEATYNLEIRYQIGDVCIDDQTEEVEFPARASEVLICAGSEHGYCFDHAGGALGAHVRNENGGDVALALRTIGADTIVAVDDSLTTECIYRVNLDAGRYCVAVEALADSTYDLTIDGNVCL